LTDKIVEITSIITEYGLGRHALALVLGLPRLTLLIIFSPFMGGNILSGQLKGSLIFALYFMIHPIVVSQLPEKPTFLTEDWILYLALAAKEVAAGFLLAYVSGIVFWAAQSAGFLMDNQRGASMASTSDSFSGEETSPLGSLLFQSLVFVFFIGGSFVGFLGVFFQSYIFWSPFSWFPDLTSSTAVVFFLGLIDFLMLQTFLLAGPVVTAALLTDVSLGLINRFASQLNVYVLAMPIKSALTMFILIFYYVMFVNLGPQLFTLMNSQMTTLRTLWP
jgi:type III secretion protein T